jgi:hypothetical protein
MIFHKKLQHTVSLKETTRFYDGHRILHTARIREAIGFYNEYKILRKVKAANSVEKSVEGD